MSSVRLGFEIGTGNTVEIPVRHMVVAGQTQESGKTTTLEALIERAQLRAVTFVTKRGERAFAGARRIEPYFREQADWQFVAAILEASRGEKMKFERSWIIKASKGARTLADVHRNVKHALKLAKGISEGVYTVLDAYLEVVVPAIAAVRWAPQVDLAPGVNAMDLTGLPHELQHLVIKSTLDWVLERAERTVVVVPEAWKFIPQGRGTPVKLSAESYIRQAAGLGNYLWLDSQDIGGVEKTILRSCPVWLLGVQREANEIKRTLENIPASIAKPKPGDIATLEIGQFYACWSTRSIKTYVQPEWMGEPMALQVARGKVSASAAAALMQHASRLYPQPTEVIVTEKEARELRAENDALKKRIEELEWSLTRPTLPQGSRANVEAELDRAYERGDENELYGRLKARLIADLPTDAAVMRIVLARPELRVEVERHMITVDGRSLRGRIARLIADGFFEKSQTSANVLEELLRRGADRPSNIELGNEMKALCEMGFFTRDNKWYTLVPDMKVNVVER